MRTQNPRSKIKDPRTRNPRSQDAGRETRDQGLTTQDLGPKIPGPIT